MRNATGEVEYSPAVSTRPGVWGTMRRLGVAAANYKVAKSSGPRAGARCGTTSSRRGGARDAQRFGDAAAAQVGLHDAHGAGAEKRRHLNMVR